MYEGSAAATAATPTQDANEHIGRSISQLPFLSNADSRLLGHAILEDDKGRDAAHAKAPWSLWIVLDIELGNFNLPLVVSS